MADSDKSKQHGLSGSDRSLWERVTESVRPLGTPAPVTAEPQPLRIKVRPRETERPEMDAERMNTAPGAASLDGGWDRRMRQGRVKVDRTVDLHGHRSDAAYDLLAGALERAYEDGARVLLVITGKPRGPDEAPRGIIARSLPQWLAAPRLRPYVAAARKAHQRHGGSGASYVILRRKR